MWGRVARLGRVPGLRRLPALRLLAIAQIVLLARQHINRLEPAERRRALALLRRGRGLTPAEREELVGLATKADARLFAALVADRLSPIPLPKRFVKGGGRR